MRRRRPIGGSRHTRRRSRAPRGRNTAQPVRPSAKGSGTPPRPDRRRRGGARAGFANRACPRAAARLQGGRSLAFGTAIASGPVRRARPGHGSSSGAGSRRSKMKEPRLRPMQAPPRLNSLRPRAKPRVPGRPRPFATGPRRRTASLTARATLSPPPSMLPSPTASSSAPSPKRSRGPTLHWMKHASRASGSRPPCLVLFRSLPRSFT